MAIPFNLPTDEETEDNYRRLDQLLLDLYHVLRQILLRSASSTDRDEGGGEEGATATAPSRSRPVGDVSHPRRHRLDPNLPDVVSSTLDCYCQTSRRRQRRRRRRNCCQNRESREQSHPSQNSTTTTSLAQVSRPPVPGRIQAPRREENWLMVGEHLRMIAEEFKTSLRKEECPKEKQQDLQLQVKTSGLFSLLVPSHFRHSLWTTVILLVGWRILVRAR